jgi:predicted RNase H-like HicB family nuclease
VSVDPAAERTEGAAVTEYVVIYEQAEDGGWGVYVPDLPGCTSYGDTREEAERNAPEAILLYLEELRRQGRAAPRPASTAGSVSVP